MIILHVTDFHFNKCWFDWLTDSAPPHDLLVMSGDMLDLSAATPHTRQIEWVADWISHYPHPMSVCSGNHDLEWDAEAEFWKPAYWLRQLTNPKLRIDGERFTVDGLSLLNLSCTTHPKGGAADIWVVHAAPRGILVATRANGRDDGDPDLVVPARRYAPRVILSGHVHDPVRWCEQKDSTLYLNPGRTPGATFPNHVLLNTREASCQLITEEKHETLMSAEPLISQITLVDSCATTALLPSLKT